MTTMEQDYNGWTNRATWNTNLWITNIQGLYRIVTDMMFTDRNVGKFTDNLEHFMWILWEGKTPDGDNMREVDWVQIANSIIDDNELKLEDVS